MMLGNQAPPGLGGKRTQCGVPFPLVLGVVCVAGVQIHASVSTTHSGQGAEMQRYSVLIAAALTLSACGGGSSSGPSPIPTNATPVFTSSSATTVPENRTGTAYQAAATDANGDALSYSISGGADAGQFTITSAGALSFTAPPDFEVPKDTNADNVYEVTLSVSDGKISTILPLRLVVENQRFQLRQLATSFSDPLRVLPIGDGSGRVYVVERRGVVWIFDPAKNTTASTPFLDLRSEVSTDGERGLLNVLVTQEKNNIGTLTYISVFVYLTDSSGDIVVRRYKTPSPTNFEQVDQATAKELFRVPHASNRNLGGALGYYGVGLQGGPILVVGFGDTDGSATNSRSQDPTSLLGKVIAGIVSNTETGVPLVPRPGTTQISTLPYPYSLIDSFGLRNTRYYDQGVLTDEGSAVQELNRPSIPYSSNLGWPAFDGTTAGVGGLTTKQPTHLPPVLQYSATTLNVDGSSVVGGVTYNGSIEDLKGFYIFGDAFSSGVWALPAITFSSSTATWPVATSTTKALSNQFVPDRGSLAGLTSIAQAADGRLFLTTASGGLYVMEIANP